MISRDASQRRAGEPPRVRRLPRPAGGWRPALHMLAGLPAALASSAVLAALVTIWAAAIWSLAHGAGDLAHVLLFVLAVLAVPVPLLLAIRAFGGMQRARFEAVLGLEIPAPPRGPDGWRLPQGWLAPVTWRLFGYHVLAVLTGVLGAALVTACCAAPFLAPVLVARAVRTDSPNARLAFAVLTLVAGLALLAAAPWLTAGLTAVDTAAATVLLGPSRSDVLAHRVEILARSRAEIVSATDAERRRIERDLHDGVQQRLVALAMNLGLALATGTDLPEPARRVLQQAHEEVTQAVTELRQFVRGLHPAVLEDRGLDAALSGVCARAPLPVRLRVEVHPRCAPSIEAVAYFVVSEALTNVVKHAAASHAEVTVLRFGDRLRIAVADDGRGGATLEAGSGGSGLRGLAQRAAAADGTVAVHSPPGGPTTITVELPCE